MKEVIKTCLDKYNNTSHTNDELSNLIIGAIKKNAWYLNMGDADDVCQHNNDLNSICSECDEEQAKDTWVCGICNESTYDVDWDYIGSVTNHLGCEMKGGSGSKGWLGMEWPNERFTNRKIQNNYGFKDDDADHYMGPDGHYEKYGDIVHKLPDE